MVARDPRHRTGESRLAVFDGSTWQVQEKGRTVRRDRHQQQIDELQTRMETVEAKLLYRLRGQTIERVFGDFKEHRNLRRFRGRGIRRARAQLGLTVLGHNLRIIHNLRQSKIPEPANEN